MSIATEEAVKESHRRCLEGCIEPAQFAFQDGYVVGRTASLVDVEIEAAAFTLWQFDNIMKMPDLSENEMESIWNKLSPIRRADYTVRAAQVLDAARQAVKQ